MNEQITEWIAVHSSLKQGIDDTGKLIKITHMKSLWYSLQVNIRL